MEENAWYGWPEYFATKPAQDQRFQAANEPQPKFIWLNHPPLTQPFLMFPSHSGVNGLDFAEKNFGFDNQAFIAMYGTFGPITGGINFTPVGFKIARVNLNNKEVIDFAVNKLPGPSYINRGGRFDRPTDVIFGNDGSLYVIDWGSSTFDQEGLKPIPKSGVIWRIYKTGAQLATKHNKPVRVSTRVNEPETIDPQVKNVPQLYQTLAPTFAVFLVSIILILGFLTYLVKIITEMPQNSLSFPIRKSKTRHKS